jgi:hypothetical protein
MFMADTLKSLGLYLGASTVSLVQVESDLEGKRALSLHIIAYSVHNHEGDAKRCLIQALRLRMVATPDKELKVLLQRMNILLPNKPKIIENVVEKMT